MPLDIQIKTFLISIIFGIVFSMLTDIFYKKKIFNLVLSLITIILFTIFYFLFLIEINNGIVHPYYILSFIIGFVLYIFVKRIVLFKKKWYNTI